MSNKSILIVGGAGYIGSHMAKTLANNNHEVLILDNLSTGFKELVKYGKLVVGDLSNTELLDDIFKNNNFDGVIHFAASSLVGESVLKPSKYYRNNISNTINLLDAMVAYDTKNLVFSSTAAIFGEPEYTPIDESHISKPINPYGFSKLMIEQILKDYSNAYGLNSISLRYFNACGADPDGELGELHNPETHLIPLVLQAASGRRKNIKIFGINYNTKDGTCIRDYIHIVDLCNAHSLALSKMIDGNMLGANAFNLGNGAGYSVKEVINVAKQIINKDGFTLRVEYSEKRAGDPEVLVADSTKAKKELGWNPKYTSLETIVSHAWDWEKTCCNIFKDN